ncbi:MAG TPA: hypothetical protein VH637_21240 [Streptosporangiaceae bacterium]
MTVEHNNQPATTGKGRRPAMYQLTQLAADRHHERLAAAAQQRPAQRALALARATRRAERRMRRAARQARRLRAQLHAHTATDQ